MAIFRQLLDDVRLVCQQIIAIICGWNWLGSIVHVITALYELLTLGTIFLAMWSRCFPDFMEKAGSLPRSHSSPLVHTHQCNLHPYHIAYYIHAHGGNRKHNISKPAPADLRI